MTTTQSLQKSLADTYVLYNKIHSFHWNVTGPRFQELHIFFETLYTQMWMQIDELAELIRIQGEFAPKNTKELSKNSSLTAETSIPTGDKMLSILIADFEILLKSLHETESIGSDIQSIADSLPTIIAGHEKNVWMLKSMV